MAEIKHGKSGYRRGCRCATCRAGHAKEVADWRAGKREQQAPAEPVAPSVPERADLTSVPTLDLTAPAGVIEQALDDDLRAPDERVAWKRTLLGMARLNARTLDQLARLDRLDLLSPVQLRMLEVLNRLAIIGFAGLGDGDGAGSAGEELAAEAAAVLAELEADGA